MLDAAIKSINKLLEHIFLIMGGKAKEKYFTRNFKEYKKNIIKIYLIGDSSQIEIYSNN